MKKFNLHVKTLKRKADGQEFKVYKIETKSGKLIDCKFRRSCNIIPQNDCIICVEDDQYNLDKPTEKGKFWCYWVYEVAAVEKLPEVQTDIEL